jgi:L-ascorbate metabolism protein UlaG (beta-lactamase superfamily)
MIPIGGDMIGNTMGVDDAIAVVDQMRPRIAIPCHYDLPSFFRRNAAPADAKRFAGNLERMGVECRILGRGQSTDV